MVALLEVDTAAMMVLTELASMLAVFVDASALVRVEKEPVMEVAEAAAATVAAENWASSD